MCTSGWYAELPIITLKQRLGNLYGLASCAWGSPICGSVTRIISWRVTTSCESARLAHPRFQKFFTIKDTHFDISPRYFLERCLVLTGHQHSQSHSRTRREKGIV